MKNLIFEILIILQTLNINDFRTISGKSINLDIIRKLIEYSLKKISMKKMFTLIFIKIALFKCSSVLSPAHWVTQSERAKYSVYNQKLFSVCWNCLTSLGGFEWILIYFLICLTIPVSEKSKNSIFEILIILQILNIDNYRTISFKSINLDIIRKVIEYSLKTIFVNAKTYSYRFWDITVWMWVCIITHPVVYREQKG